MEVVNVHSLQIIMVMFCIGMLLLLGGYSMLMSSVHTYNFITIKLGTIIAIAGLVMLFVVGILAYSISCDKLNTTSGNSVTETIEVNGSIYRLIE